MEFFRGDLVWDIKEKLGTRGKLSLGRAAETTGADGSHYFLVDRLAQRLTSPVTGLV
jgi:hypothetical protein